MLSKVNPIPGTLAHFFVNPWGSKAQGCANVLFLLAHLAHFLFHDVFHKIKKMAKPQRARGFATAINPRAELRGCVHLIGTLGTLFKRRFVKQKL